MSRRVVLIFGNLLVASALLAWLSNERGVLEGDVGIYLQRLEPILDGAVPYVDAPFEHLPLSLVPLLMAAVLDTVPGVTFSLALAVVNAGFLAGVLWLAHRIGDATNLAATPQRWLLLAGPLFPIVLFRLDPFSLLLAGIALLGLLNGQRAVSGFATVAGMAARGWPVVLVIEQWRTGWRATAAAGAAATLALAAVLLATPGFSEGRTFDGVQIETAVGSMMLVAGHLRGAPEMIHETAGSLYVGGGAAPMVANMLVGLTMMAVAAIRLRRPPVRMVLLALAVYGLLLVSPLLSAQMLLWPTLFVAACGLGPVRWIAAVGVTTTLLLVAWDPGEAWWATVLLLRNAALLATPVMIAAAAHAAQRQASISRKNLPV